MNRESFTPDKSYPSDDDHIYMNTDNKTKYFELAEAVGLARR